MTKISSNVKNRDGNIDISQKEFNFYAEPKIVFNEIEFSGLIEELYNQTRNDNETSAKKSKGLTFLDPKTQKRKLNSMSTEQWEHLAARYFSYFNKVKNFLENPRNEKIAEKYDAMALDFTEDYLTTQNASLSIYDHMLAIKKYTTENCENLTIVKNQYLMILLFYMFYHCDYGRKEG